MATFPVKRFILCGAVIGALCSALQQVEIFCNIHKERQVIANLQETVFFNCSVLRGRPMRQITWSKEDNGRKLQGLSTLPSESAPGLWSSVQISNISAKDYGRYRCEVSKDNGTDVCSVVLHVKTHPHFSKARGFFTTTPQILLEGHNPVFYCYASGWPKPSFTWLKDEVVVKDGDGNHSYGLTKRNGLLLSGLDLEIFYVRQKEDEGRYTCVAKNKFGEKRYQIKLFVNKKSRSQPKVHPYASIDQVTIKKSDNALLKCVGENTPNSTTFVSWAFKGKTLLLDGNNGLHHESNYVFFEEHSIPKVNFSLLIKNVTEQDTGAYHCKVLTLKGSDSGTIHLNLVELNNTKSKDFQYDVFISFSTLDYNWVRDNLTPVLESKRINYCIHSRDFIVGKAIIENIADSIYNSRKVLAVISRNYLDSNFCREELEIAMHRSAEMADSSLLLIRLDGVDTKNLPKTLRRRTFLDYSSNMERVDWEERLLKQIQFDARGFHMNGKSNFSTDTVQLISHL
ncbi:hypothetical protein pdam_00008431 [Pocillopora damicornis]|uniref:Soluble interferon alpha/beta receptor OPG204 n=1 Tax=Pocillopora damicornis TaxID=46731 RepID=A0A3M6TVS5_POCDA|nr:hypothetical protein pdam_00008431 [Pocillopora damicornis]